MWRHTNHFIAEFYIDCCEMMCLNTALKWWWKCVLKQWQWNISKSMGKSTWWPVKNHPPLDLWLSISSRVYDFSRIIKLNAFYMDFVWQTYKVFDLAISRRGNSNNNKRVNTRAHRKQIPSHKNDIQVYWRTMVGMLCLLGYRKINASHFK